MTYLGHKIIKVEYNDLTENAVAEFDIRDEVVIKKYDKANKFFAMEVSRKITFDPRSNFDLYVLFEVACNAEFDEYKKFKNDYSALTDISFSAISILISNITSASGNPVVTPPLLTKNNSVTIQK